MTSRRIHLMLTAVWAVLIVPTVTLWSESILWIALISVYANMVSHWAAFQASRGEEKAEAHAVIAEAD